MYERKFQKIFNNFIPGNLILEILQIIKGRRNANESNQNKDTGLNKIPVLGRLH